MNEPRPAMISARPFERRSSVAKSWNTRTGSSELSTVTALVRRMCLVRAAPAASTTAGDDDDVVGTVMLADAEHVEPELIGELDLLEQIGESLLRAHQMPGGIRCALGEGVDPDFHLLCA